MNKVTCPSALAALTLSTVLESEGHPAVWHCGGAGFVVYTDAPLDTILASCDTVSTALRIYHSGRAN